MTSSFQNHHGAMLLKYSGISFISGAVNHGFFSGTRSLWTAAVGIVLFVLGAWLEHRLNANSDDRPSSGLLQTLLLVYYTHLRAHETKANRVSRVLLRKKKNK